MLGFADELESLTSGALRFDDTAGLKQVRVLSDFDENEVLASYFERSRGQLTSLELTVLNLPNRSGHTALDLFLCQGATSDRSTLSAMRSRWPVSRDISSRPWP